MPTKRYGEQKLFWDGFQWVSKTKPIVTNIEHTTDVKKVQISGLPLELGLKADMIKDELNARLKEKYHPDKDIIKSVSLILAQNSVAVELGTRDDISKIRDAFDGTKFLGQELRVTSFEDKTVKFNVTGAYDAAASTSDPIVHTSKTAAQAAAIAKAVMDEVQGEDVKIIHKSESAEQSNSLKHKIGTTVLKVWNVVDPSYFHSRTGELLELQEDMMAKFSSFGGLIDIRMVMPDKAKLGAEAGSIFAEFEDKAISERVYKDLKESKYDGKIAQVTFVKERMYDDYLKDASVSFLKIGQPIQEIPMQYPIQTQIPAQYANKEADYEFE